MIPPAKLAAAEAVRRSPARSFSDGGAVPGSAAASAAPPTFSRQSPRALACVLRAPADDPASSSMEKVYAVNSPHKKRKSQYELSDPKLVPLKCKFRKRLSCHDDESATTESLGYDCIFMNKTSGTDMVSIPEELDSCENTMSLFGGCIEVDSKNGIQEQSLRKMFEIGTSASSSSSNNFSSEAFNSSHSSGTRETDSWVMHDIENHHSDVMLKPHNDDLERIYNVLEQYDNLMEDKLMADDVFGSAAQIMDEKLYSNGVDDIQILPTGQTGYHSEKKLTIDQEFEQYFSNLML
ncbi:hypothetical protein BDA96_01G449800 [Sorghum bicolor]|uniref:Uncharacterized protein n=2 Tax=Sorghum bicolor TaxID=4558 RepID=A0A921S5C6_SORBI|nr:uncharacterized protein LOC8081511 isoform X2 [Sorghum bicolor]KAG0551749.1 hypothetical protein BDA96_01G449800 [Sorghum bicolor]OQU92835.1 hypothetical protein SORBI_3001G422600 [Sorghum bicolor]|eukprot:XP_021307618.1 uncharacterized protein LOC8081511 isoform X2 [Sorghum bicolor]